MEQRGFLLYPINNRIALTDACELFVGVMSFRNSFFPSGLNKFSIFGKHIYFFMRQALELNAIESCLCIPEAMCGIGRSDLFCCIRY